MVYGDKLQWFLELEAEGQHVERLHQKPQLYDDLILFYRAFIELSAARPSSGLSVSAIPFSEIEAYMRIYGFDQREHRYMFVRNIRILDNVYLKYVREKESD